MAWNKGKRLLSIVFVVLLCLPALPADFGPAGGASAVCSPDCSVLLNATITNPAFLYLDLEYYDGGTHYEALSPKDFYIRIVSDVGGLPYVFQATTNPVPVHNTKTVAVTILPRSNVSTAAILYDGSLTTGAAGSYTMLRIVFDTNAMTNASFVPVDLIFRPYDRATGKGLPIEEFNITVQFPSFSREFDTGAYTVTYAANNETPVGLGRLSTFYGIPVIVRVRDYFGNLLFEQNRTWRISDSQFCMRTSGGPYWESCGAVTSNYETWDLPLSVYSFKFYNQKPDQSTKIKLFWNGTGAGEEVFVANSGLFPPWWDSSYTYRQRIKINTSQAVPDGYIYNLTIDPAAYLAAGKMQGDFRDVRVVYWNGSAYAEAPRAYTGTNLTWEQQELVNRSEVGNAAAAWHFEEGTGISAADASGNVNTGTLTNGPTWTYGAAGYGTSVHFDGSNDRIEVADSASLSITGPITLEAWIKTNSRVVQQGILEKYNPGTSNGYTLRLTGAGKLFGATIAAGADTQITGTTSVATGVWHHVAFVYTGTTATLYLDGVADGSVANTRNPGDSAESLKIGARGDDEAFSFNGDIDEPRVYNYAKTAQQIACDFAPRNCVALPASTTARDYWVYYGNPLAGVPPMLSNASYRGEVLASVPAAYWPLDAGSGTMAADISGNSNTGTLTSGPVFTTGLHRGGVAFDGSNDYIDVPNSASLNIVTNMITLEAWILCPCAGTNRQIYSKDVGVPATDRRYASYFDASSVSGFETRTSSGTVDTTKGDGIFQSGVWMNYIWTYDGALMSWYRDGVLQGTQAQTGNIVDSSTVSLNIARFHTGVSFFAGTLDELSIYPRYFSQAEVWAHYNTSLYRPTIAQPAWASLDASNGFEWFMTPTESVERILNPGYYQVQIVVDNRSGPASKANIGINITEANYLIIDGLNLTRIVGDFEFLSHQTIIMMNQFRPDIIAYGQLLPTAPAEIHFMSAPEMPAAVDPRSILDGQVVYIGAAGTNVTSYMPDIDQEVDALAVQNFTTVKQDQFVFSGSEPSLTHVWINYTSNGTNIWESSTLPPVVTLAGIQGDVYVVTNRTVQTTRISSFYTVWDFTVSYDATPRKYYATIALNNTMNRTIYEPYWFVAFPEFSTIDLPTAAVKDLDNNVWLTQGQQFTVTAAGYYMTFAQLNMSSRRSFYFEYFDANASDDQTTPVITLNEISHSGYQGDNAYWSGTAAWSNPHSAAYNGELIIKLRCETCSKAKMDTLVVVDETRHVTLDESQFFTEDGQVKITKAGVGEVVVGGAREYRLYFKMELEPSVQEFTFFEPILGVFSLALLTAIIAVVAVMGVATASARYQGKKEEAKASRGAWSAVLLASTAVMVTMWILRAQQVMV